MTSNSIFGSEITIHDKRASGYAFFAGICAGIGGVLGNTATVVGSHPLFVQDMISTFMGNIKVEDSEILASCIKWKFLILMTIAFLFTWTLYGMADKLTDKHKITLTISVLMNFNTSVLLGMLLYQDVDGTMWWSSFGYTSIGIAHLFPELFNNYYIYIKNCFTYYMELTEEITDEVDEQNDGC